MLVVHLKPQSMPISPTTEYTLLAALAQVIAFNLGSLGFLTNHLHTDFRKDLENVIYGAASLATCTMNEDDSGENSMGEPM